jgi:hypothetical protein
MRRSGTACERLRGLLRGFAAVEDEERAKEEAGIGVRLEVRVYAVNDEAGTGSGLLHSFDHGAVEPANYSKVDRAEVIAEWYILAMKIRRDNINIAA